MTDTLEKLAADAQDGDKIALEQLVCRVQDQIHRLAMRMLVDPDKALDATQEILIILVTKLSTFKGQSSFTTWLYRVATNFLLNSKKSAAREKNLTFDIFANMLEDGLTDPAPPADDLVLLNEVRISCTMAFLLCLDLKHRMAYILGDVLEFEHAEAAQILDITPDNYRKQLSRARRDVVAATSKMCGIANENAKCSCNGSLSRALEFGRINPDNLTYSKPDAPTYTDVLARAKNVVGDLKVLKLQRATSSFPSPQNLSAKIIQIVDAHPN